MSTLGSLSAALSYSGQPVEFGDAALSSVVGYELLIGAIIWLILWKRGWRWSDFAVHYSVGSTILGVALGIAVLAIWYAFEALVGKVPAVLSASLPWVAAASLVNPLFEELLVLGYIVQALRKRWGLTTAMNASLAIRLVYHLYQGPMAVIPIAIFGVVATLAYVRVGRLWPVIVMHSVLDFVGLTVE